MASPLDRPSTTTPGVPLRKAKRVGVAARFRAHDRLREHHSRRSSNDSQRVLIAVRVDTDHVIHLVCKHPDRSSDSIRRVPMTPVFMEGNRAAGL